MRTTVLTLIVLISIVCGSKNLGKMIASPAAELIALKNMQTFVVNAVDSSDFGPGTPVKILKVSAEGFKTGQNQKATVEDVEKALEDQYKLEVRKEDLKALVDLLNKKNGAKQEFQINAYEKQNSETLSPKGGFVGGKGECDPNTRLDSFQKILDDLSSKDAIQPWKIHSYQIVECKSQVVQGIKYDFKIKLGVQNCPFKVISFMDKLTLQNPEELLFNCPQILKPQFKEHVQNVVRKALETPEKNTDIQVENWKIEVALADQDEGMGIKVGGVSECQKEERLNSARKIMKELEKQNIFKQWDLEWENVLSCTNQVTAGLSTKITVNVGGIACEITVRSLSGKITFENSDETQKHCHQLFNQKYLPKDIYVEPVIYNHPVVYHVEDVKYVQKEDDRPRMVGGAVPCSGTNLEEQVNGFLDKLEKTYFNKLTVKKKDISSCTTQSLPGIQAVFTIKSEKKQCTIVMTVYSEPPRLNNAQQLFKDCPHLFVKGFNPLDQLFDRNLIV